MNGKKSFIHDENEYLHSSPCLFLGYMYNIHFVIKFLGCTWHVYRGKAFYNPKYQF